MILKGKVTESHAETFQEIPGAGVTKNEAAGKVAPPAAGARAVAARTGRRADWKETPLSPAEIRVHV